jgi:hypothetical protein
LHRAFRDVLSVTGGTEEERSGRRESEGAACNARDSLEFPQVHKVFGVEWLYEMFKYFGVLVFEIEEDEVADGAKLALNFGGEVRWKLIG